MFLYLIPCVRCPQTAGGEGEADPDPLLKAPEKQNPAIGYAYKQAGRGGLSCSLLLRGYDARLKKREKRYSFLPRTPCGLGGAVIHESRIFRATFYG